MNNLKWIHVSDKNPPEDREVLAIFSETSEFVWHARYKNNMWVGTCLDDEGDQQIAGELICWLPWPESLFKGDSDE